MASNRERGLGRPDIDLRDRKNRRAIIIEAKKAESRERLEYWCDEALRQISSREYLRQISSREYTENFDGYRQVLRYEIAFYQKTALVKSGNKYEVFSKAVD